MKILVINCTYDNSLDILPESIELLEIKSYKNKINKLPMNIKKIIFNKNYKYKEKLSLLKPDIEIVSY